MTYETNIPAATYNLVSEKFGGYDIFDDFFFHNFSRILAKEISLLEAKVAVLKNAANLSESEILEETFSMIECSVEGVHGFVAELELLGKTGVRKRSAKTRSINIGRVLDKVKKELRNDYLKTVRIHETIVGDKISCCDGRKLFYVIKNLLSNALKFSREDVYLTVEATPQELRIVVRDLGIGIPETDLERIFLPFYRCENARLISGTGIGLALVKKLLDQMNGKILIRSEIKKGTEVIVYFPLSQEEKMAQN